MTPVYGIPRKSDAPLDFIQCVKSHPLLERNLRFLSCVVMVRGRDGHIYAVNGEGKRLWLISQKIAAFALLEMESAAQSNYDDWQWGDGALGDACVYWPPFNVNT